MSAGLPVAYSMMFLTPILLAVVGFFLKNIHAKISEIDKNTSKLLTDSAVNKNRMDSLERRLDSLDEDFRKLQEQFLEFIKDQK